MLRIVLASALAGVLSWSQIQHADACGVKLTVRAPKIRAAKRSSNPSTILLLGTKDSKRLASQLKQAGHKVEVAKSPDSAKRKSYGLIMADSSVKSQADQAFPSSTVVVQKGSSRVAARDAEKVLARAKVGSKDRGIINQGGNRGQALNTGTETLAKAPTRVKTGAGTLETKKQTAPVAAMAPKTPTRAPVSKTKPRNTDVVAVAEPQTSEPVVDKPTPRVKKDVKIAMVKPKARPPRAFEEKTERAPKQVTARWTPEFYFGSSSNRLAGSSKKKLRQNAAWLSENPGASLTIEGHTDTIGNADFNLELGERRAEAAKAFLVQQGIEASRIDVVSKGEEEPAYGSGTSRKNRRVVFIKSE